MSISRRDFLKGAGALGLAATGLLGSVAAAEGAEEPTTYDIAATFEYEAVVIGCGAAGMMAAMELQAAGVKTMLLEKGASCGVCSASMAGGPALADTRVQAELNETVSVEKLYKCMYGFSNGTVNGSLLKKCLEQGDKVVGNFVDNGVPMGLRPDNYGMGFRARHNFTGADGVQVSGAARFQPLVDKFLADGGAIEYNREGVSLVKDGDVVTGVIARNMEDGSFIQYNAKAVLVATGGYAGNDKRLREHYGDIDIIPLCSTLPDGKGFDMVIEAGGIADRNWALCCNEFGGANSKCVSAPGMMQAFSPVTRAQKFAIYGGLIVNQNGDRFMNEQYLTDRPLALGGEMSLREGKYYAVVDEAMYTAVRDKGILEYYGNPQEWYVGQMTLKGSVLDNMDEAMALAISEGWAVKGTLAECAAFFGLDNLEKAVAAYNEIVASGEDTQFYKAPYLLKPLSGETYYVVESMPSIWGTFGGVKTDDSCRALTPKQKPIPGLYVAGVDNGSLYASPYYENEGASIGVAFTSGIVAAKYMEEYIKA